MTVQATNGQECDRAVAARSLLKRAFQSYDSYYGLCTTTCQVYDTAWVAMVVKTTDGVRQWLFPECFHYLLKTQSSDGSWGLLPTTQTAGILDTASALLALISHAKDPLQISDISPTRIDQSIKLGLASLKKQLATWDDVEKTNHIGVELIVPAMLTYLQKEHSAFPFEFMFPCKEALNSMHAEKMNQFDPEVLYSKRPSSALHSLEAFLGQIDFDRVSHHLYHGSMMASPSSTAAYLIAASQWDDEAERYLRHVLRVGTGHGDGGIPGTHPTTHFECSWILATLLKGGFSKQQLDCDELHGLSSILERAFQNEKGIIGFAPHTADVDDTAKGLLALSLLYQHVSPDAMIRVFEARDHFTTFGSERDPSLTSNLHHLSHLYPTMLFVEAFTDLLELVDNGELSGLIDQEWRLRMGASLFQACLRVMLEQQDDGSWGGYREQTCYAVLALSQARRLCFFNEIRAKLQSCIDQASAWLRSSSPHSCDLAWTSKTAYQVTFVAEAYELAALQSSMPSNSLGNIGHSLTLAIASSDLDGYMRLVRQTALFSSVDEWQLRASVIESSFFVPLLRARRSDVFPRNDGLLEQDKYLSVIPFTWIGCNNRSRTFASNSWLYDMMLLSLLGYQTDEYVEAVIAPAVGEGFQLREAIDRIIDSIMREPTAAGNGSLTLTENLKGCETNGHRDLSSPFESILSSLTRFASYVLNHEAVLRSSMWDRENLCREFKTFLHSHATQLEDNFRFSQQPNGETFSSPTQTYFKWVNSTGGSHVACAYSFAFSNCLVSASLCQGQEAFPTVTQKYLASDIMRHATAMCRMYNDLGSMARDESERNLNSMHFPDFASCGTTSPEPADSRMERLGQLAQYEHACLLQALAALGKECHKPWRKNGASSIEARKLSIVRLFCDVTDLYDQLYVIKDISSRLK
ncbi:Ff.00g034780.m01.CDS01 [Fusarium sp. VM40]|nr:Ff.00g034780.m01.CDS01 [Fusarium sp. VM40]